MANRSTPAPRSPLSRVLARPGSPLRRTSRRRQHEWWGHPIVDVTWCSAPGPKPHGRRTWKGSFASSPEFPAPSSPLRKSRSPCGRRACGCSGVRILPCLISRARADIASRGSARGGGCATGVRTAAVGSLRSWTIAKQFGETYRRQWQQGHLDLELMAAAFRLACDPSQVQSDGRRPSLRGSIPVSHRFQWESQNQTSPPISAVGQLSSTRVRPNIHLFVRFHGKARDQKGELFIYCGAVQYLRHQGENPCAFGFDWRPTSPRICFADGSSSC